VELTGVAGRENRLKEAMASLTQLRQNKVQGSVVKGVAGFYGHYSFCGMNFFGQGKLRQP
jgi:hypothetical protein